MAESSEIMERLASASGWQKGIHVASAEAIEALEAQLGTPLPEAYRSFLRASDGGVLDEGEAYVNFWTVRKMGLSNPDPTWTRHFPGMVVFATNEAGFLFFFDSQDTLQRGAWAVYTANMGSPLPQFSIALGPDFAGFIDRAVRGEELIAGPYVSDG